MKWIEIEPGTKVRATKTEYVIRTKRIIDDIHIPYSVIEQLKDQEWELDSQDSRRK